MQGLFSDSAIGVAGPSGESWAHHFMLHALCSIASKHGTVRFMSGVNLMD